MNRLNFLEKVKTSLYIIISFLLIGILFTTICTINLRGFNIIEKQAQKGKIFLKENDLKDDSIIFLNGQWEFCPYEYLYSDDFKEGVINDKNYIRVPATWNGYKYNDGVMTEDGYATYRIVLNSDNDEPKRVGLYISAKSPTAYNIYINGEKAIQKGRIAQNGEDVINISGPDYFFVEIDNKTEIIIQTCNYVNAEAGLISPVNFGSEETIIKLRLLNTAKDTFSIGVYIFLILFLLPIWFINRRYNRTLLYILLVSFSGLLYIVSNSQVLIYSIFPMLPYKIYLITSNLLSFSGTALLLLLLNQIYKKEVNKYIMYFCVIKGIILLCIALFMPSYILPKISMYKDCFSILEFIYAIYVLSKLIVKKQKTAIIIMIGVCFIVASVTYDVIYFMGVVKSFYGSAGGLGTAIFILFYAVVFAKRYEESYLAEVELSNRLTKIDKMKDEFLANTSHELRTPLNSMIAIIESIINNMSGESVQQKEDLQLVASNGRRLSSLINDILDYSKITREDMVLTTSIFDIRSVIKSIERQFILMTENKKLKITSHIDEDVQYVNADRYRIIQVLFNLIGNAVKFTPKEGEVHIKVQKINGRICISVKDTGIGIKKEKLNKIFNSFEQVDASVTRKYGGMGIGLSISQKIVEAHGSEITVQSEEGQGATFTFSIPASDKIVEINYDESDIGKKSHENEIHMCNVNIVGEKKGTVIIIDDHYSNIVGASNVLKSEGYSIKGYTDAHEALEEIFNDANNISVVIMDVMMPEISGYEVCCIIRERFSMLEIPILMLTAVTASENLIRCFEAGANDFLTKPFNIEELKSRVRTLYELKYSVRKAINNEIGFLQAQIKPHFLYNALNTIASLCDTDSQKAGDLIVVLGNFLRESFDFKNLDMFVPLKRELDYIESYISIEKARFGERLTINYDIDADTEIQIPPLILQPIVENAVKHGLLKKIDGGTIKVVIKDREECMFIEVIDDGIGIEEEKLKQILNDELVRSRGVGIKNINMRLHSIYGTGLEIESKKEKGTVVRMKVPKIGGVVL